MCAGCDSCVDAVQWRHAPLRLVVFLLLKSESIRGGFVRAFASIWLFSFALSASGAEVRVDADLGADQCSELTAGLAWSRMVSSREPRDWSDELFMMTETGALPTSEILARKKRAIAKQLQDDRFQLHVEGILGIARTALQESRNEFEGGRYGDLADRHSNILSLEVSAERVFEKVWQSEGVNGRITVYKEKVSAPRVIASLYAVRELIRLRSFNVTYGTDGVGPEHGPETLHDVSVPVSAKAMTKLREVEFRLIEQFPDLGSF